MKRNILNIYQNYKLIIIKMSKSSSKNKIEKIFNNWKLILNQDNDSITININKINTYEIYNNNYKLEELQSFKIFSSIGTIKDIINLFCKQIEQKKIKIEENAKNLKLAFLFNIAEFSNIELILYPKGKLSEEVIEIIINQMENLKEENKKLKKKIKAFEKKENLRKEEMENQKEEIKNQQKHLFSFDETINQIKERINILLEEFLYRETKQKVQLKNSNLTLIKSIDAHENTINVISNFPSGISVSVSDDKKIKFWDQDFNLNQVITNDKNILYLSIKDENNFVTSSKDKRIITWVKINEKFQKDKIIYNAHNNDIYKVIYNSKNNNLISCSADETVKIWEPNKNNNNNYQCSTILTHSGIITSILLLEDKNILVLSSEWSGTKFWNNNNYEYINYIKEAECCESNALCRLNNDKIIVGGGFDYIMKVISLSEKKIVQEINNQSKCCGICIVEKKNVFLTGGLNGDIRIFRIDNYEYIRTVKYAHDDGIYGLTLLKNGNIASYSGDQTIKIWKF